MLELISTKMCANKGESSGKLLNPGKTRFLRLATDSVRDFNKRDKNVLLFSHKAIIKCGIVLNLNGEWE